MHERNLNYLILEGIKFSIRCHIHILCFFLILCPNDVLQLQKINKNSDSVSKNEFDSVRYKIKMGRKAGVKNRKVLALSITPDGSRKRIVESQDRIGVQAQIFDSHTNVWENIILDNEASITTNKLHSENLLALTNSKKQKKEKSSSEVTFIILQHQLSCSFYSHHLQDIESKFKSAEETVLQRLSTRGIRDLWDLLYKVMKIDIR
jgi:hypothetical protein